MDEVFKAISDPSRRLLMDQLALKDGQTLSELCECLPEMTRFGVMSHLGVLEAAALVTTRKAGRNKHHYLNAVPIHEIHTRWIAKYERTVLDRIAAIKAETETTKMTKPTHIYQAFINAPTAAVWEAITDGDLTAQYFFGTRVASTWELGADITYAYPDGTLAAQGTVLSIDSGKSIEMTFLPLWDPELAAEGPAREIWLVEDASGVTKLTVETYDIAEGGKMHVDFAEGFPLIISGLKTLVETGVPMKLG